MSPCRYRKIPLNHGRITTLSVKPAPAVVAGCVVGFGITLSSSIGSSGPDGRALLTRVVGPALVLLGRATRHGLRDNRTAVGAVAVRAWRKQRPGSGPNAHIQSVAEAARWRFLGDRFHVAELSACKTATPKHRRVRTPHSRLGITLCRVQQCFGHRDVDMLRFPLGVAVHFLGSNQTEGNTLNSKRSP